MAYPDGRRRVVGISEHQDVDVEATVTTSASVPNDSSWNYFSIIPSGQSYQNQWANHVHVYNVQAWASDSSGVERALGVAYFNLRVFNYRVGSAAEDTMPLRVIEQSQVGGSTDYDKITVNSDYILIDHTKSEAIHFAIQAVPTSGVTTAGPFSLTLRGKVDF